LKKKMKEKRNEAKTAVLIVTGIAIILVIVAMVFFNSPSPAAVNPTIAGEAQEIRMTAANAEYSPNAFTVESGKPVRWIVTGGSSMGCAKFLVSPQLGVRKTLNAGENVIEFTAPSAGTYPFSCAMNMARGTIKVV
jgi:plastocyanin domain-containing protein